MWNRFYTIGILVILLTGCDFVEERQEETKPRDWKKYCSENDDRKLCWGGDKAPWIHGPFCHNITRSDRKQAPGTAVRCKVD